MEEELDDVRVTEEDLIDIIDFNGADNDMVDQCGHKEFEGGMEFNSQEKIYSRNGFQNDVVSYNDAGKGKTKLLSSLSRCGCKAALSASKQSSSGKWKIIKFVDLHNHEMVTPKTVTLLRSHKSYSVAAKSLTECFSRAGVPVAKVPHVFGTSDVPFEVRDCYNHMKRIKTIIYEAGDAQAVQVYCNQQHDIDRNFFYSIQFDDDSRMLNFFWVDSRSKKAYERFGDVITFDTTYRTNRYSMPFAPFVGINHHFQSVMFGCALLHDETEETFIWLFQTWLSAMKGKAPIGIITDQDAAMAKAIRKVFSASRHRLCMWQIAKKFPEKLSHFEFMGILCRHILNIVHAKSIVEIPAQYILQRWRKEGNKIPTSDRINGSGCGFRSIDLQAKYAKLNDVADQSEMAHNFIHEAIDTILVTAIGIAKNETGSQPQSNTNVGSNPSVQVPLVSDGVSLQDPQVSQKKGESRVEWKWHRRI